MNAGSRSVIAIGAWLLFLSLKLLSAFDLDRMLLLRIAGGSHAAVPARRLKAL